MTLKADPPDDTRVLTYRRPLAGDLGTIPLASLLQLLDHERASGAVIVRGPGGTGHLFLRSGQLLTASLGARAPAAPFSATKALQRLLSWESGRFQFRPHLPGDVHDDLKMQTSALVMEAMRQRDELARLADALPLTGILEVPRPLTKPLTMLDTVEIEIFQIAFNYAVVQSILDHWSAPDLQALISLQRLVASGYLSRSE